MLARLSTLLLAGAGLAACATLPPAGAVREAKGPDAYATSASFAAPASDWPGDRWWTAYGDPQLDQLMQEAFAGSPTLASAQARLARAQAATAQAHAQDLPQLGASASAEEMKQSYNIGFPKAFVPQGYNDYGKLTLDFSWEFDFWGKNRAAVAAAASEARAARADAAEARLVLSTNIATTYAELARLYAQRDLAERNVVVQQETSGLVRTRTASGLETLGSQRAAEAEPLQARSDVRAIDEHIAIARNNLAALLGAGPDRGLAIRRPSTAALKPFGLPATLAADLVGRRPDIVAARWRAEAAGARVKAATAAFYPNVNLAGFIGYQSLTLRELFEPGSDVGSIGPAISLPIFEGGRLHAAKRGADAGRDAAIAAYDSAVVEALRQTADAVASERALTEQLADSRAALSASEDAYRIARLRYQGGLTAYPAVLQAEQNLLRRRRTVTDLEARALTLDIALVRALGGGFHS